MAKTVSPSRSSGSRGATDPGAAFVSLSEFGRTKHRRRASEARRRCFVAGPISGTIPAPELPESRGGGYVFLGTSPGNLVLESSVTLSLASSENRSIAHRVGGRLSGGLGSTWLRASGLLLDGPLWALGIALIAGSCAPLRISPRIDLESFAGPEPKRPTSAVAPESIPAAELHGFVAAEGGREFSTGRAGSLPISGPATTRGPHRSGHRNSETDRAGPLRSSGAVEATRRTAARRFGATSGGATVRHPLARARATDSAPGIVILRAPPRRPPGSRELSKRCGSTSKRSTRRRTSQRWRSVWGKPRSSRTEAERTAIRASGPAMSASTRDTEPSSVAISRGM